MGFLQRLAGWRSAPDPVADLLAAALAHEQAGDAGAALQAYEQARRQAPDRIEPLAGCARLQVEAGRWEHGLANAQEWARRSPADWQAHFTLGQALAATGRPKEALAAFERAAERGATHPGVSYARGNALFRLHRFAEAAAAYQAALAAMPDWIDAQLNLAMTLDRLGRHAESLAWLDRVLAQQPDHEKALHHRPIVLVSLERIPEALDAVAVARRHRPDDPDVEWHYAFAHLLAGRMEEGWPAYEARWRAKGTGAALARQVFEQPLWTGQPLAGKTILVYPEQGLGDVLQFARFIPEMEARGARVLLWAPASMRELLQTVSPQVTVVTGRDGLPPFDYQCPIMSLALALQVTLATLPAKVPYLHADAQRRRHWAQRLGERRGLRVGLVWSGNPAQQNNHRRSVPLAQFAQIATPGCEFIVLQNVVREADQPALAAWKGLRFFGDEIASFSDTAALAEEMDLVISVCTSGAHLAGALGRPLWVLLANRADWRWLLQRDDSPWYPTARLFRQPAEGAWGPVLARVRSELQKLAGVTMAGPSSADWIAQGNEALQTWDLARAAHCYGQAIEADAANPLARLNAGFVALEQGQAANAIAHLTQALALRRPGDGFIADAQFLLGRACRQAGEDERALAAFEAAVAAKPDFAEPMEEALALAQAGSRPQAALTWAQRLQQCRPTPATALALAQALCELGRHGEALPVVEAVLAEQPGDAAAWTGRGDILMELGRQQEALAAFTQAREIAGPTPAAITNLAGALTRAGRHDEALLQARAVLQAQPGDRDAAHVEMLALEGQLRIGELVAAAQRALAHHPQDAELHWTLATGSLLLGDFARGWPEHEWRWRTGRGSGQDPLAADPRPRWRGGPELAGRTVLVYAEQGLGDVIQFLRYVPLVAARAQRVLLRLPSALHRLAGNAGLPANCVLLPAGGATPAFDLHVPLLSLPLAFGTTEATVPRQVPYLRADAAAVQRWRERIAGEGGVRLNVGITWSGNPAHRNDARRSIPLAAFRAIEAPGCRFVSLQTEVRASDAPALQDWSGLRRWGEELQDFADTASLVEALDVIVSVDTSVAHLAGALGRPLRILLPRLPDWRWMLERADSPWYPSARLERQPAQGDWASVLARVRADLQALAAS